MQKDVAPGGQLRGASMPLHGRHLNGHTRRLMPSAAKRIARVQFLIYTEAGGIDALPQGRFS